MFSIEQINAAHSKVKSGADFPSYVQDLIKLGVTYYETYVAGEHTAYFGNNNFNISSPGRDEIITIANELAV